MKKLSEMHLKLVHVDSLCCEQNIVQLQVGPVVDNSVPQVPQYPSETSATLYDSKLAACIQQ
jgi:hypothetical protein